MRLKELFLSLALCVMLSAFFAKADGTRELEGAGGVTKVQVGKMAAYGAPEALRINIRIGQPNQEAVYMGFRLPNGSPAIYFRVIDPNGNMVYGPELVPTAIGPGYINNMAEANLGPFVLTNGRGGYNPLYFVPAIAGNHYIEFSTDPFNATNFSAIFSFFDITVGRFNPSVPIPGRVWSRNWVLNSQSFGNPSFARFFVYTPDSVVTQFSLNGMRPYGFEISCNKTGVTNTGNIVNDRKSVQGNVTYPEYPIFLSNPDSNLYPTGLGPVSINSPVNISGCPQTGYCVEVGLNKTANAEVYFELNGIAGYQPGSPDLKIDRVLNSGINCIPWDGRDAWGRVVPIGTTISVEVGIIAGLTNFPIFDPERNDNGIIVSVVRPNGPPPKVFWDDSNLPGGTVELNGCTGTCRSFTNNFGNNRTMNTWWYTGRVDRTFSYRIVANCPVKARRDTASTQLNTPVAVNVLANDTDPDRNIDTSSLIVINPPRNGSFTISGSTISYLPNTNFVCGDSLRYRISDRGPTAYSAIPRYSDSAWVRIEVKAPMPELGPDSNITICSGTPAFSLQANITQPGFELRWYRDNLQRRLPSVPLISTDSAGTRIYWVTQSVPGAVCQSRPKAIRVNILPTPNSSFSGLNEEICQSRRPINLIPVSAGGIFSGPKISGSSFLPDSIGQYTISYWVASANCTSTTAVNFRVIPGADASFSGLDTTYCAGNGVITLNPTDPNGSFYLNGSLLSGPTVPLTQPGNYSIKHLVRNANGCYDSTEKKFKIGLRIQASSGSVPNQICQGTSPLTLTGQPLGGIWVGRQISGNTFNPIDTGKFRIAYVLNNNGCMDSAWATVTVLPSPNPNFSGINPAICISDDTLQWIPVQAGGVFSGPGITASGKWVPNSIGPKTFVYSIGMGPCIRSSSITVNVFAYPEAKFSGLDTGYCLSNNPIVLRPLIQGGVFSGPGVSGSVFRPNQEGLNAVTYTVSQNGCQATQTIWVRVTPPFALDFSPGTQEVCVGDAPIFFIPNRIGGKFTGNGLDTISNSFLPFAPGRFDITYQWREGGCLNLKTHRITVNALPIATIGDSLSIFKGQSVQLKAGGGSRYLWRPSIGLSDSTIANPIASPSFSTDYKVLVFNEKNCVVQRSQKVFVIQPIQSPTVFTPNGDKLNDVWAIPFLEQWPKAKVVLFDRWGRTVFSSGPYKNDYDFKDDAGLLLPAGTYFYSIDLMNGAQPITGYLELVY